VGAVVINVSARRHAVVDDDIRHAITHALFSDDIDPDPQSLVDTFMRPGFRGVGGLEWSWSVH
jgi:hypothetical protein